MSDGGTWQQPRPGGGPPPPPAPMPPGAPAGGYTAPPPPPTGYGPGPVPPAGGPPPSGPTSRSRGKLVALGVGAVLLLGAGAFAVTQMGGGDEPAGGADSAEAAGMALLEAFESSDVLGMVDVLLPGERETMRGPLTDLADELRRLEIVSEDASLSDLAGVEVTIDDEDVQAEDTNVEDIVNLTVTGSSTVTFDGSDLPVGDLITDNLPEGTDMSDASTETAEDEFDFPLTVVERDGRWYVSVFYTAAELIRAEVATDEPLEIPAEGVVATGGDSPEDAFDAFLDGVESLDLEAVIASLNPNEFEALQRYAPLFLDDAQAELSDVDVDVSFDEAEYDTEVDGDSASISITYLAGEISAEGDTVAFRYEDGCLDVTVPDEEPFNSCEVLDEASADIPPELEDVVGTFGDVLADYENPWITMKRVDGTWYLSPMATGADQVLAMLRALDREEIEEVVDSVSEVADDVIDEVDDVGIDLDVPGPLLPDDDDAPPVTVEDDLTDDTVAAPDESVPDFTVPDLTTPDLNAPDVTAGPDVTEGASPAGDDCYLAESGEEAADCFEAAVASGDLEPEEVPVYLRAYECGLGELYYDGELFDLPDAEFVEAAEKARPCFEELVESGELDELDLPLEVAYTECLDGRNWYTAIEDEAWYDQWIDCISS